MCTSYEFLFQIYNSIAASSKALFDQCSIILDGTEVFDNCVSQFIKLINVTVTVLKLIQ